MKPKDLISAGATAAGTAAAGPVGAAIAAAVGNVIRNIFGGGPSMWDQAGPGVHEYVTAHEQAFLDWMKATHPDGFGTLNGVKAFHTLWRFLKADAVAPAPYTGMINGLNDPDALPLPQLAEVFAGLGIDLMASLAKQRAADPGSTGNTILAPNIVRTTAPTTPLVVEEMQRIVNERPKTPGEQQVVDNLQKSAMPFDMTTVLVVLALALLAFVLFRNS